MTDVSVVIPFPPIDPAEMTRDQLLSYVEELEMVLEKIGRIELALIPEEVLRAELLRRERELN